MVSSIVNPERTMQTVGEKLLRRKCNIVAISTAQAGAAELVGVIDAAVPSYLERVEATDRDRVTGLGGLLRSLGDIPGLSST
jgi:hypothetical protein